MDYFARAWAGFSCMSIYLFKENSCVLLHFTPGQTKDYIISGPKEIVPKNWPSLVNIMPQDNAGLDINEGPGPERDASDSVQKINGTSKGLILYKFEFWFCKGQLISFSDSVMLQVLGSLQYIS
ncbi:hemopexin fold protein [Tanacetum coccineum]